MQRAIAAVVGRINYAGASLKRAPRPNSSRFMPSTCASCSSLDHKWMNSNFPRTDSRLFFLLFASLFPQCKRDIAPWFMTDVFIFCDIWQICSGDQIDCFDESPTENRYSQFHCACAVASTKANIESEWNEKRSLAINQRCFMFCKVKRVFSAALSLFSSLRP